VKSETSAWISCYYALVDTNNVSFGRFKLAENVALLQSGLIAFAIATVVLAFGFSRRHIWTVQNRVGISIFVIGSVLISLSAFGSYNSNVWLESPGLLLAIFISWLSLFGIFFLSLKSIAAFAAPMITLALMLESFFTENSVPNDFSQLNPTMLAGFHILFSLIGEAFAVVAAIVSVSLLFQDRAIRQKRLGNAISQAPSLDRLQTWLIRSLAAGFVFLTVGLITGSIYAQSFLTGPTPGLSIKIVWALTIWIWYLLCLGFHQLYSWSGKKLAVMSLIGLALLSISLFGLVFFRALGG
jgi:ABC-type uncharacterized transport system permease subunit